MALCHLHAACHPSPSGFRITPGWPMRTFEQNCMETDNYPEWHGASGNALQTSALPLGYGAAE